LLMEKNLEQEVTNQSSDIEPTVNNLFSESVVEPIASSIKEKEAMETEVVESDISTKEALNPISDSVEVITNDTVIEKNAEEESITEVLSTEVTLLEVVPETYIALQFSQDCWVKILDVDSQVLINKLMKANTRLELSGKAPLNVSLGRASAVNIQVNDKEFDLTAYTQSDVAKFTLEAGS